MGNLIISRERESIKSSLFDLIVTDSNPTMSAIEGINNDIFEQAGESKIKNYINNNYKKIYMKEKDIRITPGFNLKKDIMFVRLPINDNNDSINELFDTFIEIIKLISINEYKEVLIPNMNFSIYGYSNKRVFFDIFKVIKENIKNKDINIHIYLKDYRKNNIL